MNDIKELFPELEYIEDKELREKVVLVWSEALKLGKWKKDDLKGIPFTLLISNVPINLVEHTRMVTQICYKVGKELCKQWGKWISISIDYLIAGALLHDVGKLLEYSTSKEGKIQKSSLGSLIRHPLSGAMLAFKAGVPWEVVHLISAHSEEGKMVSRLPEAIILTHADFTTFEIFKKGG